MYSRLGPFQFGGALRIELLLFFASPGSQTFLFLVYLLDILEIPLLLAITESVTRLPFIKEGLSRQA
jgi:hypothetical protein